METVVCSPERNRANASEFNDAWAMQPSSSQSTNGRMPISTRSIDNDTPASCLIDDGADTRMTVSPIRRPFITRMRIRTLSTNTRFLLVIPHRSAPPWPKVQRTAHAPWRDSIRVRALDDDWTAIDKGKAISHDMAHRAKTLIRNTPRFKLVWNCWKLSHRFDCQAFSPFATGLVCTASLHVAFSTACLI